jgi:hypothetical protein
MEEQTLDGDDRCMCGMPGGRRPPLAMTVLRGVAELEGWAAHLVALLRCGDEPLVWLERRATAGRRRRWMLATPWDACRVEGALLETLLRAWPCDLPTGRRPLSLLALCRLAGGAESVVRVAERRLTEARRLDAAAERSERLSAAVDAAFGSAFAARHAFKLRRWEELGGRRALEAATESEELLDLALMRIRREAAG